jgi:hypothetical protein
MNESDTASGTNGTIAAEDIASRPGAEKASSRSTPPAFAVSQDPLLPGAGEASDGSYSPAPAYEHLGDLPPTYGSQSVYLVAYDPRQLFVYWDIDPGNASQASYGLRVCRADGEVETEVAINVREAGRYLATSVPGGTYYVELGTTGRAGRWRPLGFSGQVTLPPAGLAGEVEPKFATLPFHLSFQRLLELIQDAMGQGEGLTAALARLQAGDRRGIESLAQTLESLSQEQLQTLERLLGQQVGAQSGTVTSFGGAAESAALASAGGGSETLSSGGFGSGGASSETFGSETLAAGAAGGSEVISSAAFSSEVSAARAFGSELSGAQAFGSELSGAQAFGSELSAVRAFGSSAWLAAAASSGGLLSSEAGAFGGETLASGGLGFGSGEFASLGSSASSMEILRGLGINSEAWSLTSGSFAMSSDAAAGEHAAEFFQVMESNLAGLTAMFSAAAAGLTSDFLNSESGSSSSGRGFL